MLSGSKWPAAPHDSSRIRFDAKAATGRRAAPPRALGCVVARALVRCFALCVVRKTLFFSLTVAEKHDSGSAIGEPVGGGGGGGGGGFSGKAARHLPHVGHVAGASAVGTPRLNGQPGSGADVAAVK